jgi:hypothetical protein
MLHTEYHRDPVPNCFGCKVLGVGHDRKHLTRAVTDELNNTVTEHRSGRQDVLIRAPRVTLRQTEERD